MKLLNKISFRRRETLTIALMLLVVTTITISCESDETQEVTTLTNLPLEDNFDVDGELSNVGQSVVTSVSTTIHRLVYNYQTADFDVMNFTTISKN